MPITKNGNVVIEDPQEKVEEALRLMDTYTKTQLAMAISSLKSESGMMRILYQGLMESMDGLEGIDRKALQYFLEEARNQKEAGHGNAES